MNSDISTVLTKLLSLPWICYVPVTDESVVALIENHAVNSAFIKLKIYNSERYVTNWVFQHNQKIINFPKHAEETINAYLSIQISEIKFISLSPVVSELEIITIGFLGILSKVNNQQNIIIPQSYEISIRFFDTFNCRSLFSILDDSKMNQVDTLCLFYMIIKFCLAIHFLIVC